MFALIAQSYYDPPPQPNYWPIVIISAIVCSVFGGGIGHSKGRTGEGFFLGLLFGPLGLIVAAVMKPTLKVEAKHKRDVAVAAGLIQSGPMKVCPFCAEQIQAAAIVCKHCQRDQPPPTPIVASPLPPMPTESDAPQWTPDPIGRFEYRWWDGQRLTEHVKMGGIKHIDPKGAP